MVISFSIFTFNPGDEDKVRSGLDEHLQFTQGQPGHQRSFIAQALDNPSKYLLYSEWDTPAHYEAIGEKLRTRSDAQTDFEAFFDLMSEEPVFGSFLVQS